MPSVLFSSLFADSASRTHFVKVEILKRDAIECKGIHTLTKFSFTVFITTLSSSSVCLYAMVFKWDNCDCIQWVYMQWCLSETTVIVFNGFICNGVLVRQLWLYSRGLYAMVFKCSNCDYIQGVYIQWCLSEPTVIVFKGVYIQWCLSEPTVIVFKGFICNGV